MGNPVRRLSTRNNPHAVIHLRALTTQFEERQNALAIETAPHQQQPRLRLRIGRRSHHDFMNIAARIESRGRHQIIQSRVPGGQLGEYELAEGRRLHPVEIDA